MRFFSRSYLVALVARILAFLDYWNPARPVSPLTDEQIEEMERRGEVW